jgi:hypothetical protein
MTVNSLHSILRSKPIFQANDIVRDQVRYKDDKQISDQVWNQVYMQVSNQVDDQVKEDLLWPEKPL